MLKITQNINKLLCYTLFLLLLIGCNPNTKSEDLNSNNSSHTLLEESTENSITQYQEVEPKDNKVLIVKIDSTFTNKNSDRVNKAEFITLRKKIKKNYVDSNIDVLHIIMPPKYRNKKMEIQGLQIEEQIKDYFDTNPSMKGARIIMLGHSAGSIPALEVAVNNEENFRCAGLFAVCTPFKGANIIKNAQKEFNFLFNKVFGGSVNKFFGPKAPQSIKQITPGNPYLKVIQENIKNTDMKILAIGAPSEYFNRLSKTKTWRYLFKKTTTEKKIFGSNEHDGLISMDSQLGTGFEQKYKNFKSKRLLSGDNTYFHSRGIQDLIYNGMKTIIKMKFAKFLLNNEDKKRMLSIKKEVPVTESDEFYINLFKFVDKVGFLKKNHN